MLKKALSAILILTFFLKVNTVGAEGEFKTDVKVAYKVKENGITEVTNTINLENLYTDLYVTSYSLILERIKPESVRAYDAGGELTSKVETQDSKTKISVSFNDAVVGKGKTRAFQIVYADAGIASRTGEVWEITVPRLSSSTTFTTYDISFSIPVSFGQEAYLSPAPVEKEVKDGYRYYLFDKSTVEKTGITAGFGEFQVFAFNLTYHLENPLVKSVNTDVAVPPDTALQKVYYESFTPKPDNIRLDTDGNWLASFNLKPRERTEVSVKGYVQIFAGSRPFGQTPQPVLVENLKPTLYWQADDPSIIPLAIRLKTAKNIYDYVTTHLTYNLDRATSNAVRLGAVEALKKPREAICTEFTDLFIAIARAAGIPAREINGFAYTENPKIQPLSLVSDVLHSWPEYWDSAKSTWVSVDPTWGATTGGVDFFNKLDLRHFAFVIHGADPQKPYPAGSYKLGPSPQKDVFVSFAQLPEKRAPAAEISLTSGKFIPFTSQKIEATVTNRGSSAFYNLEIPVYFDSKLQESKTVAVLPPFAGYSFEIPVSFSFLGNKIPQTVSVSAGEAKAAINTNKKTVITYNLAVILFTVLIILIATLARLGKIKFKRPLLLICKDLFTLKGR